MAIIKSAKKSIKRSRKNYNTNIVFKNSMKRSIKLLLKAIEEKRPKEDLLSLLQKTYSSIDKAAKKWIIKKQNAARKKSRLVKKIS